MHAPTIIDSPSVVRRVNRARVLDLIRLDGPLTRPEVVRRSGLSKATVREVCDDLLAGGLVAEERPSAGGPRGPGRPPAWLRYRGGHGHVVGLDLGAGKVLALVADLAGAVVGRHHAGLAADRRPARAQVLAAAGEAVRRALDAAGVQRSSVRAVVAGTPGVVAPRTGVIGLAPQIEGWEGTRLGHELEARLGLATRVENEVQLAVVGERWRGAAHDLDAAVYLQLGIGIAAGILVRGELVRGAAGGAGEIGYLPLPAAGAPPEGIGSFEWAAGGHAFARAGQAAARAPGGAALLAHAGGDAEAVDARAVFAAAAGGDPAAGRIVDELAGRIAHGVAALACVLNPAVVVVGGGLSNAGALLLDPLRRHVERLVPLPPRLVVSELGGRAVAVGAVRLALEAAHASLDLSLDP
jgi:predicted NBD/HSP70 family sugar kinase